MGKQQSAFSCLLQLTMLKTAYII